MSTIHLQVAPRVGPAVPRGSRLAAAVFLALWRRLARVGHATPTQLGDAQQDLRDVQAVRDLAASYRDSDPGFAGDLLAAADRHEQLRA